MIGSLGVGGGGGGSIQLLDTTYYSRQLPELFKTVYPLPLLFKTGYPTSVIQAGYVPQYQLFKTGYPYATPTPVRTEGDTRITRWFEKKTDNIHLLACKMK